jgi:signal transduction histidine kinase
MRWFFSKLNQGLPDYLPKALIDAPLLSRAIRYAIEGKRVEREFGQLREELQRLARSHRIELEAVDRELATFSYSVSHELQNSLQGITGFSQILISEYGAQIPAQAQQFLQMLNDGAQEMKLLVEGLLSFSRLSCQPLNKEPVKLSVLVLKVLDRFGPEREKRKVKVRLGNLADCIANPPLLDQMFTHLLSNAFKFTRRREKAIIEVAPREASPIMLVIVWRISPASAAATASSRASGSSTSCTALISN